MRWVSWPVLGPGVAFAVSLAVVGERLRPPASDVSLRCVTIVAVLLAVKLVVWVARTGHTFAREERLLTFVMFVAIVLSWIGVRQAIGEAALDRFETETVVLFERRFGRQVRNTHDLLTLRGLRTRDFDLFYRRPANEFQMRVIAAQLAFLAKKLDENKLAD
jgi:hypothetical protein